MNDETETILLIDRNIKITSSRVRIGTKDYSLANITSAKIMKERTVLNFLIGALILIALVVGLFSLGSSLYGRSLGIAAFLILGAALVIALSTQPTYHLLITSTSGTIDILQSMDEDYVRKVYEAILRAVSRYR